jgi:hypothetical protein
MSDTPTLPRPAYKDPTLIRDFPPLVDPIPTMPVPVPNEVPTEPPTIVPEPSTPPKKKD